MQSIATLAAIRDNRLLTAMTIVSALLGSAQGAASKSMLVTPGQNIIAIANAAEPGTQLQVSEGEYSGGTISRGEIAIVGHGTVRIKGRIILSANRVQLEKLVWEDQDSQLLDIRGANNIIRACTFRRFGKKASAKAIWIRETGDYSGNLIENCLFEDWGGTTYHSSCIKIGQYTNREAHTGTVVRNCTFRNGAIGGNNPAIQPFCSALIEGNTIHDCEDGIEVKGNNMAVRNNTVYRCFGGEAMSNRSGSHNVYEGNLLYDIPHCAWQIWTGTDNIWRNNVVLNCGRIAHIKGGDSPTGRARNIIIANNTCVGNTRGISWHNRRHAPSGVRIINNIFAGTSSRAVIESQGNLADYSEDYNLIVGYAAPAGRSVGPHSIVTDNSPGFVNAVARDFRLRSDSPAIDAGLSDPTVASPTDRSGAPRPQGSSVDIGAYEHQP